MDTHLFSLLRTRYTQLGGMRLVRQYARMGLLWPAVRKVVRHPFSRETYKQVYFDTVRRVEPLLRERYGPFMRARAAEVKTQHQEHSRSKIVWFCWLQGLDNAPNVVKACHESIIWHIGSKGYKVYVIDESNWQEYVSLPDFVIRRRERKEVPSAHFADLLRLELLIKYGGTWIDATVLCTGEAEKGMPLSAYLDTDLFMFQYTRPNSDEWGGIGNWFISSCTNNEVLTVLRDMLYAYWQEHDCVLSYYLFHTFFDMLREVFPEEIASMPYAFAPRSLALVHHWAEPFDKEKWARLTSRVCFHKLTYMVDRKVAEKEGTYYEWVMNNNDLNLDYDYNEMLK